MSPGRQTAPDRAVVSRTAGNAAAATGLLSVFHGADVLGLADLHTAVRVGRICREPDERVLLALALAVRALRLGSVCITLDRVHETVFDAAEEALDTAGLPWPEPVAWWAACADSPLVSVGAEAAGGRPLRLVGELLYLERYWRQEETVRRHLLQRWSNPSPALDPERLRAGLSRLFADPPDATSEPDRQRLAAAVGALSSVTVLAGGPGTGKTTTVARVLALLADQPAIRPRIALAAPTGKAAARLSEAVARAGNQLGDADRARLGTLSAVTLHRLLGWLPGGRFRHHARHHLPHDVVVVDEMSMVSLTMMARLLEAVRPSARLILVGDPDQLSSVEAGAVLADITGAPGRPEPELDRALAELGVDPGREPVLRRVVTLRHTWRFGGAIDALARAIRAADADQVLRVLRSGAEEVEFVEADPADPQAGSWSLLADEVRRAGRHRVVAAAAGDVTGALAAIDEHRLLCGHRRGPYGVTRWSEEAERWLGHDHQPLTDQWSARAFDAEWYVGRPVLVVANDYDLGLYNGDIGVVVATALGPRVAFGRGPEPMLIAPVRLDAVQTVHAMTVHRAQGSQFGCVSFIVPPAESPLLSRELFYTAVTRASRRVQVFGTAEAVRRAVMRPANRASGLRQRL